MLKRHLIILLLILFVACNEKIEDKSKEEIKTIKIATVNYPLYFLTKTIGGDAIEVLFPVPSDVDPAYWELTAKEIEIYQSADLIILNGAGYAKWLDKVSLSKSRLVNSSLSFSDEYIKLEGALTHSHGPGGEHGHDEYAFTTWLDFHNAKIQARAIKDALTRIKPTDKNLFEKNYKKLAETLDDFNGMMNELSKSFSGKSLLASHPVYQYMAQAYNFNVISLHWEQDIMPDEFEWDRFNSLVSVSSAKIMIWEGEPLPEVTQRILERGIQVVVFNPCTNYPASGDYISVMNGNILELSK